MDIWTDIQRRLDLLDVSLREIGKRGADYANAEAEYRSALSEKILELRSDGMPVTITSDVARGTPKIAKLRLDRDCKEALYKASLEAVQVYKLQIKVLEAQMNREYNS